MSTARRLTAVPEAGPFRDGQYIRVSAVMGRDDERFLSPDLQRQAITRARSAAGASVLVAEEVDLDVSGGTMDRPGLNRLLALARGGEINRLWVLDLSRWARTTTEGLAELERIEAAGCKVMSTAEAVELSTPEGYFSATLMLAVHKMRRDQIARGWRAVARHRVERGHWHGQVPLGYRRAEKGGIEPDPVLGPAMRDVFRRYASGHLMSHIARDFNRARGKPTDRYSDVKRALGHSLYIGKVRLGDEEFDGRHEPLVDMATWRKVQQRLAADRRTPPRRLARSYALTGLVRCDACGGSVIHHRHGGYLKLECREQKYGRCDSGCGQPRAESLAATVLDQIQSRYLDVRLDDEAATVKAIQARAHAERRRLSRELDDTRTARGRLAVSLARGVLDEGAFRLADRELAEAEDGLVLELADQQVTPTRSRRQNRAVAKSLIERWPQMLPEEQNRGLTMFVRSVTLRRGGRVREPMRDRIAVSWRDDA